jgi:hypothetical protein
MPIILWGSRGLTSHLDQGRFHCPQCQGECGYALNSVREWFTLYFIPLFPIGGAQRYVECRRCGTTFTEAVLDMPTPGNDTDRMMTELYRDMEEGQSRQEIEGRLQQMGLDPREAQGVAGDLIGEDGWTCQKCSQTYLKAVRACPRCRAG